MTPAASTSPVTGGVLAVHAHPDDETLATGALLATWAAQGRPALVVTCTRGERGEVIGAAHRALEGDGAALAAHRTRELEAATRALGADQVFLDTLAPAASVESGEPAAQKPRTGPVSPHSAQDEHSRFEDSGMAWLGTGAAGAATTIPERAFVRVPLDRAARPLAALVRRRRPDLVVTYEPGGGYGHPDHVRAHEVTMRAVALAADPAVTLPGEPWAAPVAWAVVPEAALRAGYAALAEVPEVAALLAEGAEGADRRVHREGPLVLPDPAGPLPSVAVAETPDLVVDVLPVRDRVLAALRAHATQVQAVTALEHPLLAGASALSNLVLAPLLRTESYRWAPGHAPTRP
ncbi:PIG-L family deacetylase [Cellulomonas triticagri]|uniref:GlcNAc-PI de-N-acetylase n=1 Tax=Cellulomonas triticagri TaxID=2483352 RepID=A0A3M2JPC5_9CELL|nr:PIG-L family deacetylase [Cellulomonas triticagri]RMI13730.1 GlcNAc-PI de-N-acetylase [Cellulomonas triticagri]